MNHVLSRVFSIMGGEQMSYQKPEVKEVKADVTVRNMAADKGECHGGHCVRCLHAFG